ncbi:ABC-2 type transport system permease protein [Halanaerobium sp. ST460_2HS_T2]|nr:ABC-2 type transport system permease protein [Halanaerobium sp. ST460_2HS_T2]
MKKYFRNRMESIGSLIQPMLWLLLFSVGMSSFFQNTNKGFDYLTFVLPGMIGFTLLSASINGGTSWLNERMNGIVKSYMVAPISRFAPLAANVLTVLSKALIQGAIILIVGILLGAKISLAPANILVSLLLIILFGFGFSGIALYFASKAPNNGAYHMVIFMFQMPLLFFSNALYSSEKLPLFFKIVVNLNPMTYLIAGLREMMVLTDSIFTFNLLKEVLALLAFALFGILIAIKAYKEIIDQE